MKPFFRLACCVALACSLQAQAAEWTLKLSTSLAQSYSDNIRMVAQGQPQQGDWVTQLSPGLALTAEGPRLKLDARYQMLNQFYTANRAQDSTRHQLNANAHSEWLADLLFLDGTASIGQQSVSALAAPAMNSINISANRADITTLSLSPYLRHRFGSDADGELRYNRSEFASTAAGLANSQTDRLNLKLDSGTAFRSLGWSLAYSVQQSRYSNYLKPINNENAHAQLSYHLTPRFALTALTGYEKSDYVATGLPPVGAIYSAGFSWQPSPRSSIEASAGQRYFGNNYALTAKHRTRRTNWSVSYNEDITTTQAQFLAAALTPANTLMPVNLLSNQVFLQKRLQATSTLTGRRNTLTFSLYDISRSAQTPQMQNLILLGPANLALGNNSNQLGGNVVWTTQFTPQSSGNLMLNYAVSQFPGLAITSTDRNLQLGYSTRLQSDLSGHFDWRHNQRSSNAPGAGYQENALSASLTMKF